MFKKIKIKKKYVFYTLLLLNAIFLTPILKVNATYGVDIVVNENNFPSNIQGQLFTSEELAEKTIEIEGYVQDKLTLYGINAYFFHIQQFNTTTNGKLTTNWSSKLHIIDKNYISNIQAGTFGSTISEFKLLRNGTAQNKVRSLDIDLRLSISQIQTLIDNLFISFSYNTSNLPTDIYRWGNTNNEIYCYTYSTNYTNNILPTTNTTHQKKLYIFDNLIDTGVAGKLYSFNDYFINNQITPIDTDYQNVQIYSIQTEVFNSNSFNIEFSYYFKQGFDSVDPLNFFKTYSLYLENGLYHWEEDLTCLVNGDYSSTFLNFKYKIKVNDIQCNFSDGSIKKVFVIGLNNVIKPALPTFKDNGLNNSINIFSDIHIKQTFNTSDFKYINFSTSELEWEYLKNSFLINNENIYVDLFSTENFKYIDTIISSNLNGYNFYNIEFGRSIKRGFWLTYNVPITNDEINEFEDFNFDFYFVPNNLYYNIQPRDNNKYNNNAVIINENGDIIDIDLGIPPFINPVSWEINNLSDLFTILNRSMNESKFVASGITALLSYIFSAFNFNVQSFILSIFIITLIVGIFTILKRSR